MEEHPPVDATTKDVDLQRAREAPGGQFLTTSQGVRIADNQNSLKAGSRGPTLLEDFILREKITHFDHERIPERVVHARGSGAHGYFQVYESLEKYTRARFLCDPSTRTPVFVRFSTVAGSRGSADTVRDARGFATKFYTDEGVFDLVGNNFPVFFIQDAMKFPDVVHAVKPEPHNDMPQAAAAHDTFWDFTWLTPESMHMIMWLMSDRAIPRSFRMMEGFGVNTFRLLNASGEARLVKFHWKPLLGIHSLVWDEAQKIAGMDPDFLRRDLWNAIERGEYPEFEFGLQLIDENDELNFPFDPLDPTKVWPEELVPVQRVGKLTLNRNPDNFFAETEQIAFHPGHVVPGIDFSNDPLLQGRLFSYLDTQLTRLGGPNFAELPINRSVAPVHNNQRDGFMRQTINTSRTNYQPNSIGGGCPFQAGVAHGGFESFGERVEGHKIRERSPSFGDHFSQPRLFWNSQAKHEREHIIRAFRFELGKVQTMAIRQRMVDLLTNIDTELASQVAFGIGVPLPSGSGAGTTREANARLQQGWEQYGVTGLPGEERPSTVTRAPELSMAGQPRDTVESRLVALLAADGVDGTQLAGITAALAKAGAHPELVSPSAIVRLADGTELPADRTLLTAPSVIYDAVFVPGGKESVTSLLDDTDALMFVTEVFKHSKTVGASGEGVDLLVAATPPGRNAKNGQEGEATLLAMDGIIGQRTGAIADTAQSFITALAQHRHFSREPALKGP
ncbi:MAG TPA: catalase [Chloroflexota bacterium]|nr:catalase [Chloroflexota bacterium]